MNTTPGPSGVLTTLTEIFPLERASLVVITPDENPMAKPATYSVNVCGVAGSPHLRHEVRKSDCASLLVSRHRDHAAMASSNSFTCSGVGCWDTVGFGVKSCIVLIVFHDVSQNHVV